MPGVLTRKSKSVKPAIRVLKSPNTLRGHLLLHRYADAGLEAVIAVDTKAVVPGRKIHNQVRLRREPLSHSSAVRGRACLCRSGQRWRRRRQSRELSRRRTSHPDSGRPPPHSEWLLRVRVPRGAGELRLARSRVLGDVDAPTASSPARGKPRPARRSRWAGIAGRRYR